MTRDTVLSDGRMTSGAESAASFVLLVPTQVTVMVVRPSRRFIFPSPQLVSGAHKAGAI